MYKLFVMGVSGSFLNNRQSELLSSCKLIVGSDRLVSLVDKFCIPTVNIAPLSSSIPAVKQALKNGDVGVMASGDPLFFGIGRRLLDEFGPEQVEVYPALSSVQLAMARFKLSWEDARVVSLHGRSLLHEPGILLAQPKTVVLTDRANSPDQVARRLIDYLEAIEHHELFDQCRIMVAENLGFDEERIFSGGLRETAESSFSNLNILCLLAPVKQKIVGFGLTEKELRHSRGLITKDEIRAITLYSLRLPVKGVFWDVGAGSGSISIEAARLNPGLTVYAVEHKEEEMANIKANVRNYDCYNVVPVAGMAPDVLRGLPDPQRVFIGGSGGRLDEIIHESAGRLSKDGRMVVNAVTEKTAITAPERMIKHGFVPGISSVNITRTVRGQKPSALNQISIITGSR